MRFEDYRKSQVRHIRCVVCGHSYASQYLEEVHAFPVYHPILKCQEEKESCEHRFYNTLLRIYTHIHNSHNSVPLSRLIMEFNWRDSILMRKDMVTWCLSRGYLSIDNLSRLMIPEPVRDLCEEVFCHLDPENKEAVEKAVAMLQCALKVLRGKLCPVPPEAIPIKPGELQNGESTLYANIDTSQVELERDKRRMVTIERRESPAFQERTLRTR